MPADLNPDGQSVLDAWRGKSVARSREMYWEWRGRIFGHVWNISPILAMRDGPYKLLMNADRSRVELYDITNDRREQHNIADDKPQVVERMSERLLAWQEELPRGPMEAGAGDDAYPWPRPRK